MVLPNPVFHHLLSFPAYKSLEIPFELGCHGSDDGKKPLRTKSNTISSLCTQSSKLLADAKFWKHLETIVGTRFRVLRFRQYVFGNILKGIVILRKEKVKQVYEFFAQNFLKVFTRPFNKKYAELIVMERIYPGIPKTDVCIPIKRVHFHQEYDKEAWSKLCEIFFENERGRAEQQFVVPAEISNGYILTAEPPSVVESPLEPGHRIQAPSVVDGPLEAGQQIQVSADIHHYERSLGASPKAIQVASTEPPSMDGLELVTRAAPKQIDIIRDAEVDRDRDRLDFTRAIDPTVEYTEPQPREEVIYTERDVENNIHQLQRDFDRIDILEDEVPVSVVKQTRAPIPDIVVESERTRTDIIEKPIEPVPESERTEHLLTEQDVLSRTIRISDLVREHDSWREIRRKKPKRRIPITYTHEQMKRMIGRPLVKSPDVPTQAAEVYSELRPNVLNPLRLLLKNPIDIHDIWEAPVDYVAELKKYKKEQCTITLQQMIPLCHGTIFERLNPGFPTEMSEEGKKDREIGQRALRIVASFSKIPTAFALQFYEENFSRARPSFLHDTGNQLLDIPGLGRKSSILELSNKDRSSLPVSNIPPRPSVEPYLVGKDLDKSVQDLQLLPPVLPHIIAPEEESRLSIPTHIPALEGSVQKKPVIPAQLESTEEPLISVPTEIAILLDDVNRLRAIQELTSQPGHIVVPEKELDRTKVMTEPTPSYHTHMVAAGPGLHRIEVIEKSSLSLPAQRSAVAPVEYSSRFDVSEKAVRSQPAHILVPEKELVPTKVMKEPRPSYHTHMVAAGPELDRIEVIEEPTPLLPTQRRVEYPSFDIRETPVYWEPTQITAPRKDLDHGVTHEITVSAHVHVVSEEDLNRDKAIQESEPSISVMSVAIPHKDLNRIEFVEESRPIISETPVVAPQEDLNRIEFVEESRPIPETPVVAALQEDLNRTKFIEESRSSAEIRGRVVFRRISESEVVNKLNNLFREKSEPLKFVDLCPINIGLYRFEAAQTFGILLELHTRGEVRLKNEVEGMSSSTILIYSKA